MNVALRDLAFPCKCIIARPDPTFQEKEASHYEAIKNQALGEGLQAYKLEKLSRYETHLDRKFERSLAMLIKLKELMGSRLG